MTRERPRRTLDDVLAAAQAAGSLGDRPIADVIQHAECFVSALPADTHLIIDLGTGAGVPGLVIADRRPGTHLVLVDRRATRIDGLRRAVAALGLTTRVTVIHADAADLARKTDHAGRYDTVVSRGFGSPEYTAQHARPLLRPGGVLIVSEPPVRDPRRWPDADVVRWGFVGVEFLPGVVRLTADG